MSHVFISYKRQDLEIARAFARQFEAAGVRVWIDQSLGHGEDWSETIGQAIDQSSMFLILWSEEAGRSREVLRELDRALGSQARNPNFRIVPVCIDSTPLPPSLGPFHAWALDRKGIPRFIEGLKGKPSSRQVSSLDPGMAVGQMPGASSRGEDLVSVPLVRSIYANAFLVAPPSALITELRRRPDVNLAVFVETARKPGEEPNLRLVRTTWSERHPDETFFLLHVVGPASSKGELSLPDDGPNGQWLDCIETTHLGASELVGSGAVVLQMFLKSIVPLALALGWRFERLWHAELFHFRFNPGDYRLVVDTREIGRAR